MEYTKEYFIEKFSNLKNEDVGEGLLSDKCALYHVGVSDDGELWVPSEEAKQFMKLIKGY